MSAQRTFNEDIPLEGLSHERKALALRYMAASAEEPAAEDVTEWHDGSTSGSTESVAAIGPSPLAPEDGHHGPRRRGRPRGRRQRRQVHFHVDQEEDLLLLAAARQFGSQQKGLIAALRSLQEAVILRQRVAELQTECERQHLLLAEAQALFNGSQNGADPRLHHS
jgi:hypothetical protein